MRDKNYSTGLRGVLFEARHYERMGAAIWLYGWLVLRQTHQHGGIGWVLGGAPISYREIEDETGFNARTLERWMKTLRQHGYVETEAAPAGVIVRITKAKKFTPTGRNSAEGVRRFAGAQTQNSVPVEPHLVSNHRQAGRIGSSSLVESKERVREEIHTVFHNHTQRQDQNQPQNLSLGIQSHVAAARDDGHQAAGNQRAPLSAREQLQLLRAARDEAVRRELAVGAGPEVRRP